jgi:hypothetical protein
MELCRSCIVILIIKWEPVGFEVLTAVIMKISIFWDITQCSLLKLNRRFEGTLRLHLQGPISLAEQQRESRFPSVGQPLSRCYLARLTEPWRWRRYILPKRRLTFNEPRRGHSSNDRHAVGSNAAMELKLLAGCDCIPLSAHEIDNVGTRKVNCWSQIPKMGIINSSLQHHKNGSFITGMMVQLQGFIASAVITLLLRF